MIALLASHWAAPAAGAAALLAVWAGLGLGAVWDRGADRLRGALADYHTPPTGSHRR